MSNVSITTTETTISVNSPYDPAFVTAAKKRGGKWDASTKSWVFDIRDEAAVREICMAAFGTDGSSTPVHTVTVRLDFDKVGRQGNELRMFGRSIARRASRDYAVRLGEGVVVISGGFAASGGSMKNPSLAPCDNTVLEVRDIPASLVEESDFISIIQPDTIDRSALETEAVALRKRLAEIEDLLSK